MDKNTVTPQKSADRLQILKKIDEYEKNKWWDKDVEDDPETIELKPDKIDYLNKKLINKLLNKISNKLAVNYFEGLIKKKLFIIDKIVGIENYLKVNCGAIITCNHFNPCDNYAVFRAIRTYLGKKNLHKVIREGNYTNFPGLIGFFFRHCNTLPISSNLQTMRKFYNAISTLLKNDEKILIYPEQAMWWNYKKPRPLKDGAFNFAVKNNVPIIPVFITMEDSEIIGPDGFNIQKYTLHFLEPLYKQDNLSDKENIELLKNKNYDAWVKTYEDTYKIKLKY